jgi:hypothetical protein
MFETEMTALMPIWNWIMASSEQSQVPIIFCLETIVLCIAIPVLAGTFWTMWSDLRRISAHACAAATRCLVVSGCVDKRRFHQALKRQSGKQAGHLAQMPTDTV